MEIFGSLSGLGVEGIYGFSRLGAGYFLYLDYVREQVPLEGHAPFIIMRYKITLSKAI